MQYCQINKKELNKGQLVYLEVYDCGIGFTIYIPSEILRIGTELIEIRMLHDLTIHWMEPKKLFIKLYPIKASRSKILDS